MVKAALNAFNVPDLRRKILFTLGLLVVFRIAAHVPVPGVNTGALQSALNQNNLLQMLNILSGGSLQTFSIVAMGVYPYITSSIVMQLLVPIVPRLEELSKEGEYGRNKINQYTRILTVPLALIQGYGQMLALNNLTTTKVFSNFGLFSAHTLFPTLTVLISLAAGTVFAMWLGELITENGIGNGISLIIFAGIVARLPTILSQQVQAGNIAFLIFLAVVAAIVIFTIVFMSEGQRRIPVQYAKRIRGNRMYQGQSTHIPLRVNSAGMIPLIFALSIVVLPGTVSTYFYAAQQSWLRNFAHLVNATFTSTNWVYWFIYFWLVIGFTYFYTAVTFQQQNLPETLQRNGGFIPGHRPGKMTERYLNTVLTRITVAGALFLAIVAVFPYFITLGTGITTLTFSSTAILIVVGVAIDTMKQLEAQLMMRQYEGFINR
ncbi:MAG TPA: preprotein translocase subunit SecY [Chloroflexota bacterium]|nr:preprotein translocase subunit SecY [Chloroflexota bacterium]